MQGPKAGNLVRTRHQGEEGDTPLVVEVEGLPNLLHEFVHFALRERLEVDHGYDYSRIPFDTSRAEERAWLWEELDCCVVSCAYLARDPVQVSAWFEEQIGIQHHFFGFEASGPFREHVEELLDEHGAEAARHEDRAYRVCEDLLARHANAAVARPPARLTLRGLWPSR